MENHKNQIKSAKTKFMVRESLRVGKVLAPYNARPKAVPLIKFAKETCLFKYLFFPKEKKIN